MMTLQTTTLQTTTPTDLGGALDALAAAFEQARDDPRTRAVLTVVVQRLESAAGACLGDTDGDPVVVLQRRFGRAHTALVERPAGDLGPDLLHGLARALRPQPVGGTGPHPQPAPAAVPAGC